MKNATIIHTLPSCSLPTIGSVLILSYEMHNWMSTCVQLLDRLVLPCPPLDGLTMSSSGIDKLNASTSVSSDNMFVQEPPLAAIASHCTGIDDINSVL